MGYTGKILESVVQPESVYYKYIPDGHANWLSLIAALDNSDDGTALVVYWDFLAKCFYQIRATRDKDGKISTVTNSIGNAGLC